MPKINMEYLTEVIVMDWFAANNEYCFASKQYYKKHGYGVHLDRPRDVTERQIVNFYHNEHDTWYSMRAVINLLDMDEDQIERLYAAERAVMKWYEKTQWERCLPQDVYDRLEVYVFGENPKKEWWEYAG